MVLGSILNPVNSSLIAVALIPIGQALNADPAQTAWLVTGLYLATAVGQPVVGRLVDLFGPRALYIAGALLVGAAGLLGACAPSLTVLVVARVVIGIGTCAGYPAAMYLIRSEAKRTGRDSPQAVLTLLAISTQTIAVIGPSLGGALQGVGSWRLIFALNVPLAIVSLVFGFRRMPRGNPLRDPAFTAHSRSIDVVGMLLFGISLTALMSFLMAPRASNWYILPIAASVFAGFVIRECRAANPFLDVRVIAGNIPLLLTYLRQALAYMSSYGFLYGFVQWLDSSRNLEPAVSGLIMMPLFGVAILGSAITGMRPGIVSKLAIGGAAMVAGCSLMLFVNTSTNLWIFIAIASLMGLAQALISLANQNALYRQSPAARIASSAGLLRTFTYMGAMFAAVAIAACFPDGADTPGLHNLAVVMLVCSVALVLVTTVDRTLLLKRQ
ncbi:MFS transporter [Williamsia muralis]|uniref:MFS transporter n=2 Tax=Williamsia marianensis TaxID=85044 RepID=A0A2G3PK22_WILMA|nr:MFS transporter [Williamsia marianensis]